MSVDPLAGDNISVSTYVYVADNPLMFVDPDGKDIKPVLNKGAGKNGRDLLTIVVTGKIINFSDNNVNMERALGDIKSMVESSYKADNIDGIDVQVQFDFEIAESMEDVDKSDHLIVLSEMKRSDIPGTSDRIGGGGKVAAVDADYFTGPYDIFIGEEGERTAAHEFGHLLGLSHESGEGKISNLMTQGRAEYRGNNITKSQMVIIKNRLKLGNINLGRNYDIRGLPNLGYGYQFAKLTNTKDRNRRLSIEETREISNE